MGLVPRAASTARPRLRWFLETAALVLGSGVLAIAAAWFWLRLADIQWASYLR